MEIMRAGGFVMWIILVLSIGAGAVVLERLPFSRRASTNPVLLEERLGKALFEGDRDTASRIVAEGESSLHHLFSAAIAHWQIDAETLKLLLEQEIRRELFRWEKGLALLGTAARLAPLLGLLGTVLGMVEIFRLLPESAASPKAGVSAAATAAGWPVSIAGDATASPTHSTETSGPLRRRTFPTNHTPRKHSPGARKRGTPCDATTFPEPETRRGGKTAVLLLSVAKGKAQVIQWREEP